MQIWSKARDNWYLKKLKTRKSKKQKNNKIIEYATELRQLL